MTPKHWPLKSPGLLSRRVASGKESSQNLACFSRTSHSSLFGNRNPRNISLNLIDQWSGSLYFWLLFS